MSEYILLILTFIFGSLSYRFAFGCNKSIFIYENITRKKSKYWKNRYYSLRNDFVLLTQHPDVQKVLCDIKINSIINKRKTLKKNDTVI